LASQTAEPWGAIAPQGISSYLDNGWSYVSEIFNGIVRISHWLERLQTDFGYRYARESYGRNNFWKKIYFSKERNMPRSKRNKILFSRNISSILIVVRLIFSRNVESDRAVSTESVLSPQNAFGAPLFSDIGIFGIFATESSSPHTIYWFEVSSDFLQLSR
jgi:hypothetical protein